MNSHIRFATFAFLLVGCSAPIASTLPSVPAPPAPAQDAGPDSLPTPAEDAGAPAPAMPGVYDGGGPAVWTDAGFQPFDYSIVETGNAARTVLATCDLGDELLSGSCVVENGTVLTNAFAPPNTWLCAGTNNPGFTATVYAIAQCQRSY